MVDVMINGQTYDLSVSADMPLLWVLRDVLHMMGTKFGCGIGQCGACTVHVDGQPWRACITPIQSVQGKQVTTIEGIAQAQLHPLQQAWVTESVPQCGYCQSGQIMSAIALLRQIAHPTDAEIDAMMSGNLCRCGTYGRIRKAIHLAAKEMAV